MIQRELDEMIRGGIPCSGLISADPDHPAGCQELATHYDSAQVPWCNGCDPTFKKAKIITQSEINRLVQQLVDLRAALEPFAAFAECLPLVIEGEHRATDTGVALNCYYRGENYNITFPALRQAKALLDALKKEDFERWVQVAEQKMAWRVKCSQCEALCVNGVATHESGCSNAARARFAGKLSAC